MRLLGGFLDFGGGGGSGHQSGVSYWVFIAGCVAIVVASTFVWLRKGGKGPAVNWVPLFMRPWVNRFWASRGWPPPYDDDLNKIPRNER
jgi:hypothetical protein